MLRYVERNPVRARLVRKAERWVWSSARYWQTETEGRPSFLEVGPVERPAAWLNWVNQPLTEGELQAVRASVNRGRPFGGADWVQKNVAAMGLQATLKPQGRPRKLGNDKEAK